MTGGRAGRTSAAAATATTGVAATASLAGEAATTTCEAQAILIDWIERVYFEVVKDEMILDIFSKSEN